MNMPHLLVDITAHGYGHVSQTAPVVNELARRIPGLRVTLRCAAPLQLLRQRFTCDFKHIPVALDFGMQMSNAVDVEIAQSAAAYRAFHADWDAKVQQAAEQLRALQPDLLLANVPYLSLAAADVAGVRAAAMCCLNWADIYRHYCTNDVQQPGHTCADAGGLQQRRMFPESAARHAHAGSPECAQHQPDRTAGAQPARTDRCMFTPSPLHRQGAGRGCRTAKAATTTHQGEGRGGGRNSTFPLFYSHPTLPPAPARSRPWL